MVPHSHRTLEAWMNPQTAFTHKKNRDQNRGRGRDLRWAALDEGAWSPTERPLNEALVFERDQAREQLRHVRELTERLIEGADTYQDRIRALEVQLREKTELVEALESENEALIAHVSQRENRVRELEKFVSMMAEAGE
jgi:hypothetical protein